MSARWSEPPVTPLGPFVRTAGEMGRLAKGWLLAYGRTQHRVIGPLSADTDRRSFEALRPELSNQPPRAFPIPSGGVTKKKT